ncbi:LuxR C-terminal-related transcriptional regulator [Arthrobacter sp. H14-L1]|nr:LuxR C-terminal-related transcriptional regulator [Arthrobacter sp. H14-L1]
MTDAWVDRGGILAAVVQSLRSKDCPAVFVVADMGLGASSLLHRLGDEIDGEVAIVAIHSSPSLTQVPYGALAPYLRDASPADMSSPIALLRTLWAQFQLGEESAKPVLLLIDDAHALDDATAGLVAQLVLAGWAKLAASCKPNPGIPGPLLELWRDGAAERFDLLPLNSTEARQLCKGLLSGEVLESAVQSLLFGSGGNPLLLTALLRDALRLGTLVERNGLWLMIGPPPKQSQDLMEVVRRQLMRISAPARDALTLISLAEPVSLTVIEELFAEPVLAELLEHRLIVVSGPPEPSVRPLNPVYAEVLRELVPAARSMQLRQLLAAKLEGDPANPHSLLRTVTWSLSCGMPVPENQLLRAAELACGLNEGALALQITAAIQDPLLTAAKNLVMSRVYFRMGQYARAAALLDKKHHVGVELSQIMPGTIFLPQVVAARQNADISVEQAAELLRRSGVKLAELRPENAERILAVTSARAALMLALKQSFIGAYDSMGSTLQPLLSRTQQPDDGVHGRLTTAVALALEAERNCVLGFPVRGQLSAATALSLVQPDSNDVTSTTEIVVERYIACALVAGDWPLTRTLLDGNAMTGRSGVVTFGGAVNTVLGYVAVRQGRVRQALQLLVPALEELRLCDERQLFRLCAALAFYASVRIGNLREAERLAKDYAASHCGGMYLTSAQAQGFFDAGMELLRANGDGLLALQRAADAAAASGAVALELHALELCIGLGDRSRLDRFGELAESMEGPWAGALCTYARALAGGSAAEYLQAGHAFRQADMPGHAATAYAAALKSAKSGMSKESRQSALAGLQWSKIELDVGEQVATQRGDHHALTDRERDALTLAALGLTDKQIAARLHVSIRTVQGHLYRSYAKLGVSGREELGGVARF